ATLRIPGIVKSILRLWLTFISFCRRRRCTLLSLLAAVHSARRSLAEIADVGRRSVTLNRAHTNPGPPYRRESLPIFSAPTRKSALALLYDRPHSSAIATLGTTGY